jgi:hypothetical protein
MVYTRKQPHPLPSIYCNRCCIHPRPEDVVGIPKRNRKNLEIQQLIWNNEDKKCVHTAMKKSREKWKRRSCEHRLSLYSTLPEIHICVHELLHCYFSFLYPDVESTVWNDQLFFMLHGKYYFTDKFTSKSVTMSLGARASPVRAS